MLPPTQDLQLSWKPTGERQSPNEELPAFHCRSDGRSKREMLRRCRDSFQRVRDHQKQRTPRNQRTQGGSRQTFDCCG